MRSVFFKKLHEAMKADDNIFLLVGDTGFNLVESLFEEFPERTLNVGVAEQNLIGISAGLCNAGFRPFCYAISNFLVHRCLEQVRNDVCLHNYPITLLGTAAGYDNGGLGATHHIIDDIGCLKPLPNMKIYSPSSVESAENIFEEILRSSGPAYVRIAKGSFSEGNAAKSVNRYVVKEPNADTAIISHGKIVKNAIDAASKLKMSVFAMDKIKPLEEGVLAEVLSGCKHIIVAEDNFKSGLYNSICQFSAEHGIHTPLHFIGPEEAYEKYAGDLNYYLDKFGLTSEKIAAYAKTLH